MRRFLILGALAAAGGALLGTPIPAPAADEPEVAGFFRKSCAACHSLPDPGIRADRAWIGQIARTS